MKPLSEQQAICDAAISGKWEIIPRSSSNDITTERVGLSEYEVLGKIYDRHNARLTIAARNDYPALIEWAKSARELLHDMGMDGDLSPMHGEVNLHRYRDRFQQLLRELQP